MISFENVLVSWHLPKSTVKGSKNSILMINFYILIDMGGRVWENIQMLQTAVLESVMADWSIQLGEQMAESTVITRAVTGTEGSWYCLCAKTEVGGTQHTPNCCWVENIVCRFKMEFFTETNQGQTRQHYSLPNPLISPNSRCST